MSYLSNPNTDVFISNKIVDDIINNFLVTTDDEMKKKKLKDIFDNFLNLIDNITDEIPDASLQRHFYEKLSDTLERMK